MIDAPPPSPFAYVLGAVLIISLVGAGIALNRNPPRETPAVSATPKIIPGAVEKAATIADAEEFFATWGGYLVWENGTAEFALWSKADRDYTQFFEARDTAGTFEIRRIPALTRPLIDHGNPTHAPIAFTETHAMRTAFYRQNPGYSPTRDSAGSQPSELSDLPPRPPRAPQSTGALVLSADRNANERNGRIVTEFLAAVRTQGLSPIDHVAADLRGLLQVERVEFVSPISAAAEFDAAISQRRTANESIVAMASALMSPPHLEVWRRQLARELKALEAQRTRLPVR